MKQSLFEKTLTPRAEDFTRAMLPATRRRQLRHLLKNKSLSIYQVHLLTVIWFLPLMLWHYLAINYTNTAFSGTAEASLQELPTYFLTVYGTALPLWVLAFVGMAGGIYVLRRMAWAEHVRVWKDFWRGVRQSGAQAAAVGLVFALLQGLLRYAGYWLSFYQQMSGSSLLLFAAQISSLAAIGVLGGITIFTCCVVDLYRVNFLQAWAAGLRLFMGSLFSNGGVLLLSVAPMLVPLALGTFLGWVAGYFVILVGGLGFAMLLWVLLGLARCDQEVNRTDYPDNYLRGLSGGKREEVRPIPAAAVQPAAEEPVEEDFEIL